MVDRRYLTYFDWGLLALTGMLAAIGLMTLYSAVMAGVPTPQEALFTKQLIWYGIGLVAMLVNVVLNWLLIPGYSYFGASVATIISLAVLVVAGSINAALRPRGPR